MGNIQGKNIKILYMLELYKLWYYNIVAKKQWLKGGELWQNKRLLEQLTKE